MANQRYKPTSNLKSTPITFPSPLNLHIQSNNPTSSQISAQSQNHYLSSTTHTNPFYNHTTFDVRIQNIQNVMDAVDVAMEDVEDNTDSKTT
jgi:ABC-type sulfate transport system substrate-binding protein